MSSPPLSSAGQHKRNSSALLRDYYRIYRDYMKHEDNLINQRSTWHLLIQGFLFGTMGVIGEWQWMKDLPDLLYTERHYLVFVLSSVGFLVAVAAFISLYAADRAIEALRKDWLKLRVDFSSDHWERLPVIAGGGHRYARQLGKLPAICIPLVIAIAWAAVFRMALNDKLNPQQNITLNTPTQPQAKFETLSCAQAASANPATLARSELIQAIACSVNNSDVLEKELADKYNLKLILVPVHSRRK